MIAKESNLVEPPVSVLSTRYTLEEFIVAFSVTIILYDINMNKV